MRVKAITINRIKRFTSLQIEGLQETCRLVMLIGPNGCGKSSLFDAMNLWYKLKAFNQASNSRYYIKSLESVRRDERFYNNVKIDFYGDYNDVKGLFYFRTAHRNEPDFTAKSFTRQESPIERAQVETMMQNDCSVAADYQRLISSSVSALYKEENAQRNAEDIKRELIGRLQDSIRKIFNGLELENITHPFEDGTFFFKKGESRHFPYCNLSAGEKAAFDLLLDLTLKRTYYPKAVYCIDEPETHMHTSLQASLLEEMYHLIPDEGQLWLATHSIGMMAKARELEAANQGSVAFIDFGGKDFDDEVVLRPSSMSKALNAKFLELSLGNYISLSKPSRVVFCEGDPLGCKNNSFDSRLFDTIFGSEFPDTQFVSVGACTDVLRQDNATIAAVSRLFAGAMFLRLIDRDDMSDSDVAALRASRLEMRVHARRNIESYLLADEIIIKYCASISKSHFSAECISLRDSALRQSIQRGNPTDDFKSAAGTFYVELKKKLGLTRCGATAHAFMLNNFAPLVTPETRIYQELKREIFGA